MALVSHHGVYNQRCKHANGGRSAPGWRLSQPQPAQPRRHRHVVSAARSPQQPAPLPPRVSCGEEGGAPLHIRAAELRDYWPAADLHTRVFCPEAESDRSKALSMRVDRIIALQINDRISREGGGNSVLLLAFNGEAPGSAEERTAAEAAFAAAAQAAQTPGSVTHLSTAFPNPMWWLARPLGPGVRAGMGVAAESVGLVGVAAVDSFCDLVPPRELDPRRDGAFGLYRRDGYAYVSNVAVLPAARRRGVARQLMAAAEALAAEWGCKAVGLHCNTKKTAPWLSRPDLRRTPRANSCRCSLGKSSANNPDTKIISATILGKCKGWCGIRCRGACVSTGEEVYWARYESRPPCAHALRRGDRILV